MSDAALSATPRALSRPSLKTRLAAKGIDGTTLLVLPGLVAVLALFVYPFAYGVVAQMTPFYD